MFEVRAVRNGGGQKWSRLFDNADEWINAVRESHFEDRDWEPLEERVAAGDYPTTEEWLDIANGIVESAEAVTISADKV